MKTGVDTMNSCQACGARLSPGKADVLNAVAAALPDLLFVIDDEGRFVEVLTGQEHLLYREAENLPGKLMNEVFPADKAETFLELIHSTIRKQEIQVIEYELEVSGGKRFFEGRSAPLREMVNSRKAAVFVARDITQRRKMEERFHQSQKMETIGLLASGIAHDLNNILGGIVGFSELSLIYAQNPGQVDHYQSRIRKATQRASHLVNQILLFSRKGKETRTAVFLQTIAKEVVHLMKAALPATTLIRSNLTTETRPILADPNKIHEIILNLCTNAAHAMGERGTLEIMCSNVSITEDATGALGPVRSGIYSRLTVRDNGCGIPNDVQARIFEPFFTTKKIGDGTGMGLAVVFDIVKSLEGNILVSTSPGKGTTFDILLPQTDQDVLEEREKNPAIKNGDERVLFVDDDETSLDIIPEMLRELGYSVAVFDNSMMALKAFQTDPGAFDLVITDQTMSNKTGIELSRDMLKIRDDIHIILCTGLSTEPTRDRAMKAGVKAFLVKPISIDDLANTVRSVLDQK